MILIQACQRDANITMTKTNEPYSSFTSTFFITLCIMGFFAILSSAMSKNPVLNPFARALGTPEPLLGFVASASTVPGILVSLPAGRLSDRIGRRRILLLSSIVFASAPFLYLLITVPWQLILVRFYHGFATAMFVPVANAAIAEKFPSKKAEKISIFSSVTYAGRIVAPILGGFILSGGYVLPITNWNYQGLYSAVAVAGAFALLSMFVLFVFELQKAMLQKTLKIRRYFPKQIALISLVEAAQYYTFGAYEFYLAGYATFLKLDALSIGIVAGAQLATIALVKPFAGKFSDKTGRKTPIVVGLIIGSIPLIVTPFVSSFPYLVLVSIIYGAGFSLVTSSTGPFVADLVDEKMYGTALGLLSTIMDVGQTLGPIITGFIFATALGYFGAFVSLGVILLILSLFFSFQNVAKRGDLSA